ncbi:MAG TPA: alcohol dehydrogenase [Candidatus Aminicenantes bacterium]|nr:MAG: alcohol dehydrogenase [Candidatus Aminicenantes bacterium]HEK85436.1 alcohol dehydrogenase [Candidatus Aminicenantes bacterium]
MIQVILAQPEKIEIREVRQPRPAAGEVLLKIKRIGICGSDIHAYYGKHPYIKCPIVQGHEFSAEVAELGPGVSKFKIGERVTVRPQLTCGQCYQCRHGNYHICENLKVIGCQAEGAAQEFLAVPQEIVVKLPDSINDDLGAMVEPLAVGVHAVGRLSELKGRNILILGAGPIGNLTAQAAKALGASSVMIADISDIRLEIARKCGVDIAVNNLKQDLAKEIKDRYGEAKADAIFECVGSGKTVELAINLARKGSEIIVVGVFEEKPVVDFGLIQDRELRVIGSLMYKEEDYDTAISLIESKKVQLEPLISRHFSLRQYAEAYKYIENNREKTMKVLIDV